MAVQTSYPGVYVQEVPSGVRTIAGVSTSVAVFIGQAVWGPVNEPILCLNYTEFVRTFTNATTQGDLARQVKLFFLNGGTQCYVMRLATAAIAASTTLFSGGVGTETLIVTARYPGVLGNSIRINIIHEAVANIFTLKLFRVETNSAGVEVAVDIENWSGLSMDPLHPRFAINYVNYKWAILSRPVAVNLNRPLASSTPLVNPYLVGFVTSGSNGTNIVAANYTAAYPLLEREVDLFNLMILPKSNNITNPPSPIIDHKTLFSEASAFCERERAFLLMDPETTWTTVQLATHPVNGVNVLRNGLVNDFGAVFFPRLTILENGLPVQVSAAGAIAGLMARTDGSRGVWKAPAGTEANLLGVSGLEYKFSDADNGVLNPRGINTIRIFPNGIVNWGARTMDGDDDFASEYKYIPIRRTALFIEESLYRGLKWVVFEPNDEPLWAQIRLNVGAFMHNLFRQGAFQGTTKSDAYFVKCDYETTTQNDINLGIVNVWVGFAPLKPAEFVILYLQQMTGQIQV